MLASPADVARGVELLRQACATVGRDLSEVAVSASIPDWTDQEGKPKAPPSDLDERIDHAFRGASDLTAAGATHATLNLALYAGCRAEAQTVVQSLVTMLES